MASHVQIDEIHLALLVPSDLDDAACDACSRIVALPFPFAGDPS